MLKYICHPNYENTKNFTNGEDLAIAAVELIYKDPKEKNNVNKTVTVLPPTSLDQIMKESGVVMKGSDKNQDIPLTTPEILKKYDEFLKTKELAIMGYPMIVYD